VKAGTLRGLVARLTPHTSTGALSANLGSSALTTADTAFFQAFLVTFRSFTTGAELFDVLLERYHVQPPTAMNPAEALDWKKMKQTPIRLRYILHLIAQRRARWLLTFHVAQSRQYHSLMAGRTLCRSRRPTRSSSDRRIRPYDTDCERKRALVQAASRACPASRTSKVADQLIQEGERRFSASNRLRRDALPSRTSTTSSSSWPPIASNRYIPARTRSTTHHSRIRLLPEDQTRRVFEQSLESR